MSVLFSQLCSEKMQNFKSPTLFISRSNSFFHYFTEGTHDGDSDPIRSVFLHRGICATLSLLSRCLSLSAHHRIDKSLELPTLHHRESIFLHTPGNAMAVFSVVIAAFHQRKENMVVYPAADAANARI